MREKTLATLAEMEAILSDTLSFARDEAADEQPRSTDLAALLQSLIDDHADLGGDARYQGPERLNFICRPVALRRALNNLIDNALKYGESVVANLTAKPNCVIIHIDDAGPGIPADQLKAVLTPFFRLEASRNRETGGTGLGLAVANSIILAHGGEMSLSNRPEGGLRVTLRLNQLRAQKTT
jgi:signal transduction histidine kinase